jgi:flagellar basal-body rod protein FlgC
MGFDDLFAAAGISASGMAAERLRMEVIANNLANAFSTRTAAGGPFRRQDVVFEAVLADQTSSSSTHGPALRGVRVAGTVDDPSEFQKVYQPGHPDADREGFVLMPNVQLPTEMVNLLTASRAYEANLKAAQTYRQMNEQALTLMRG